MKKVLCSQVGGETCPAEFTAETKEEMLTQLGDHAKVSHAEMMASATPESMADWNKGFDAVWEAAPTA